MSDQPTDAIQRRDQALQIAHRFGQIPEGHHQAWVIDQMCRVLLGDEYPQWVADRKAGPDGPNTYVWDEGVAP